jgi:hypothetical protein
MRKVFRDIVAWELACKRPLPEEGPKVPSPEIVAHCVRIVHEEVVKELLPAIETGDLAAIADGAMDSIWVILETLYFFGIDPVLPWDEVVEGNMAKHLGGTIFDKFGKVAKPPSWVHPDISAILAAQPPLALTYSHGTGVTARTS